MVHFKMGVVVSEFLCCKCLVQFIKQRIGRTAQIEWSAMRSRSTPSLWQSSGVVSLEALGPIHKIEDGVRAAFRLSCLWRDLDLLHHFGKACGVVWLEALSPVYKMRGWANSVHIECSAERSKSTRSLWPGE